MKNVVDQRLRDSAGHPDAACFLNVAGVCPDASTAKTAGNMLCHIRHAGNAGGGQKPDDFLAMFGCGPCHAAIDNNGSGHGIARGSLDWYFYVTRAHHRTLRWWYEHGFLVIGDGDD